MSHNESKQINIVFASDDNYAQHAAVAAASILLNAEHPEKMYFFILEDGISEKKQRKIQQTIESLKGHIVFIPVKGEDFSSFFVSAQLSRAAYFRLAVAHLLPQNVGRAIYLDCDLLVFADIEDLWYTDMGGAVIAAVPDCGIMASSRSRKEKKACIGLPYDMEYFNSGVILMDIDAWRNENCGEKLAALVKENDYPHHDQDALNELFLGRWCRLPLKWNVIPPVWFMFMKVVFSPWRKEAATARQHPAILHYAGGYKPWEYDIYEGFNDEYYKVLEKTAFSDAKMPQFDKRKKHRSIGRQMVRLKIGGFWGSLFGKQEKNL